MGAPELLIGDLLDAIPDGILGGDVVPARSKIALEEFGHIFGDPGRQMNAVGDVADGNLVFGNIRPQVLPHPAGDLAVKFADAVAGAGHLDRKDGHIEFAVAMGPADAAEAVELLLRDLQGAVIVADVTVDQAQLELIDAGGHGGVAGEHGAVAVGFLGFLEGESRFLHQEADALQGHEGGVALVHMADIGPQAEAFEGAQAADAEDDLLLDARLLVSAVELVGDLAIARLVLRRVGVEEVERDASDIHPPDPERDLPLREVHRNEDRLAGVVGFELDRKIVEVVVGVGLLLPPVGVQVLAEVSLLVEQADADERDAQLARRLEVVARENAEASGVDRQAFRQAELHGEVGDPGGRVGAVTGAEPGLPAQVVVQLVIGAAQLGQEAFVPGRQDELLLPDRSQHPHGIVVRIVPEIRVELAEELDGIVVPRPVEVVGELLENRQLPR